MIVLPAWPPRDWRAFAALVFSVLGAVVLTAFVWWGAAQLLPEKGWTAASEDNRATTLRWALWIATGSIGLVLMSLGMAINRRTLRARWGDKSAEFDGGDDAGAERTAGKVGTGFPSAGATTSEDQPE